MQWKTPSIFLPPQRYIQFLKMSSVFFFCPPRFTFAAQIAHLEFVGGGNIFADFFGGSLTEARRARRNDDKAFAEGMENLTEARRARRNDYKKHRKHGEMIIKNTEDTEQKKLRVLRVSVRVLKIPALPSRSYGISRSVLPATVIFWQRRSWCRWRFPFFEGGAAKSYTSSQNILQFLTLRWSW